MANKMFTVKMEIEAPDKDTLDSWIDCLPHAENIFECDIECEDDNKLECRIRYDENYMNNGEHYVFENKWTNEEEWGLDTAFKLYDHDGKKGDLINYQALTKIRDLRKMGISYYFC